MTLSDAALKNLALDMRRILGTTTVKDAPVANLLLAMRHAQEWQAQVHPLAHSERGGSSSPTETEERNEDRRVSIQAVKDAAALPRLRDALAAELVLARYAGAPTPELAKVAARLAETVARCIRVVDHDDLEDVDECRSCARPGKVRGQHFPGHQGVPVYAKARKHGLCRWCYDFWKAEHRYPPVDVLHLYHTQSPRAAGLEMARRLQGKKAS